MMAIQQFIIKFGVKKQNICTIIDKEKLSVLINILGNFNLILFGTACFKDLD